MAKSKKQTTGVDNIIAYLQKNRDAIGAIVVAVTRTPNGKLLNEQSDKDGKFMPIDNNVLCADVVAANDADTLEGMNYKTPTCRGLAALLNGALNR